MSTSDGSLLSKLPSACASPYVLAWNQLQLVWPLKLRVWVFSCVGTAYITWSLFEIIKQIQIFVGVGPGGSGVMGVLAYTLSYGPHASIIMWTINQRIWRDLVCSPHTHTHARIRAVVTTSAHLTSILKSPSALSVCPHSSFNMDHPVSLMNIPVALNELGVRSALFHA